MTVRMRYQMFVRLAGWMALLTRSDASKDAELLVLRQEVTVLCGRTLGPSWTGRYCGLAPTSGFVVHSIAVLVLPPCWVMRGRNRIRTAALVKSGSVDLLDQA